MTDSMFKVRSGPLLSGFIWFASYCLPLIACRAMLPLHGMNTGVMYLQFLQTSSNIFRCIMASIVHIHNVQTYWISGMMTFMFLVHAFCRHLIPTAWLRREARAVASPGMPALRPDNASWMDDSEKFQKHWKNITSCCVGCFLYEALKI